MAKSAKRRIQKKPKSRKSQLKFAQRMKDNNEVLRNLKA